MLAMLSALPAAYPTKLGTARARPVPVERFAALTRGQSCPMMKSIGRGLAAGAAGTTALNAATYVDMVLRGRPASKTPEQSVEQLSERTGVTGPGEQDTRQNRVSGLGALMGMLTGAAVGAGYGAAHELGWRPSLPLGSAVATGAAMVGSSAPMTLLGITDPRKWSVSSWLTDLLPHLAYGVTTAATFAAMRRRRRRGPWVRGRWCGTQRSGQAAQSLPAAGAPGRARTTARLC
jgi:hypothetical protein